MDIYLIIGLSCLAGMFIMLFPTLFFYSLYSTEKKTRKNSQRFAEEKLSELYLLIYLGSGQGMDYDAIMKHARNIHPKFLKNVHRDSLLNFFRREVSRNPISILGDFLHSYDQGDRSFIDQRSILLDFLSEAIKSLAPEDWARILFVQLQDESTHKGLHSENANKAKRFMLNAIKTQAPEKIDALNNELKRMVSEITEADLTNRKIIEAGAEVIFREIAQSNMISV